MSLRRFPKFDKWLEFTHLRILVNPKQGIYVENCVVEPHSPTVHRP